MTEKVRDATEFRGTLAKFGNLWTDVRLRAVIGHVGDRWVLLALHADLLHETEAGTLDLSDVNVPDRVTLLEEIHPFAELQAILGGIESGKVELGGLPVEVRGFKGGRTIVVRGHAEQHLVPSDIAGRWTDPWPAVVFSLGTSDLKDMGFDEEAVRQELSTGDFDHEYLFEITREVLGFEVGGAWGPNIYVVAPIPVALVSGISPQRVSVVVKAHANVASSDLRVRVAEGRDSARFRRSLTCDAMGTSRRGLWRTYAQNFDRAADTSAVASRLIFKGEQVDRDYQGLEKTRPGSFVEPSQNIKIADSELGLVELRYPPFGDFQWILKHLEEPDPRLFTCRVLAHQLVQPDLTEEALVGLEDKKVSALARYFVEGVDGLRSEFRRRRGKSYFADFQDLFRRHLSVYVENARRVQEQMQSVIGSHAARLVRSFASGPWKQIAEDMARQQEMMRRFILPASQLLIVGDAVRDAARQWTMVQNLMPLTQVSSAFPGLLAPSPRVARPPGAQAAEAIEEDLLDQMLRDIDAELVDIRRGAWQTFRSESADSMRQAFHSMRELVRELLKRIAPDDQVKRAPWYQLPKGTVSPVTRKQRARFVLVGFDTANPRSRVDSLAKWLELVEQSLNSAYGQLSAVAHGERLPAAESYLHLAEDLVMILLSSRVSPEEER